MIVPALPAARFWGFVGGLQPLGRVMGGLYSARLVAIRPHGRLGRGAGSRRTGDGGGNVCGGRTGGMWRESVPHSCRHACTAWRRVDLLTPCRPAGRLRYLNSQDVLRAKQKKSMFDNRAMDMRKKNYKQNLKTPSNADWEY
nr:hypothetical protein CFP56_11313 [Quercus suber]